MARKHKHPEHVNHERWLVSYADFITLLFAFFVVMFAVSQVDSKKVGRFTESFKEATEWQVFSQGGQGLLPGSDTPKVAGDPKGGAALTPPGESAEFADQKKSIRKALAHRAVATPSLSGLRLVEARDELVLRLPERLMFDRAEAKMHEDGRQAIQAIAEELAPRAVRIRIEGHTDSTPISTSKFPSNWELSTARAMAVVAFILDLKKISPERLAAAGYSEHHPVASNETADGRAQNRRVDIVVIANPASPAPAVSASAPVPSSASSAGSAPAHPTSPGSDPHPESHPPAHGEGHVAPTRETRP